MKKQSDRPRRKWKIAGITAAALAAVAGTAYGIVSLWPVMPPSPENEPEKAVQYLAGTEFRKLPLSEKRAYLARFTDRRRLFRPENLPEEQRKQLAANLRSLREAEMNERMKLFFAATPEEQNRMLDEDIARFEKMRREREARMAQQKAAAGDAAANARPGRTPPNAQQRREREATSNPVARAQHQVYMQKLRDRMQRKVY